MTFNRSRSTKITISGKKCDAVTVSLPLISCAASRRINRNVQPQSDNDGALMMKVGTSEYRRAGALNFMVADTAGPVKFRARLTHPAGNRGIYRVIAYKLPASLLPTTANIASNE